jgi:hypothetical protein
MQAAQENRAFLRASFCVSFPQRVCWPLFVVVRRNSRLSSPIASSSAQLTLRLQFSAHLRTGLILQRIQFVGRLLSGPDCGTAESFIIFLWDLASILGYITQETALKGSSRFLQPLHIIEISHLCLMRSNGIGCKLGCASLRHNRCIRVQCISGSSVRPFAQGT